MLTYLQESSAWKYQGTTLPIRMITFVYVIWQCPGCCYKYEYADYKVSCLTEQRHLITPEKAVPSGGLHGQQIPEVQINLLFYLTRPSASLQPTGRTVLILCFTYKCVWLVACQNVIIRVKLRVDTLEWVLVETDNTRPLNWDSFIHWAGSDNF